MNTSGSVILLLALCSSALVEGFNFDRDVLSHFRSKRQALKRVCAAELYSAPLNTICKTPGFLAHDAAVKKCLGKLKMKSLADPASDPVCVFDCVYQENKWASAATGALDTKKIEADVVKGVNNDKKNDKSWGAIVSGAIKKCGGVAASKASAKISSGYATKCKTTSYVAQTCLMTEIYNACPAAARAASYNAGKTALVACDPTALFKTAAELAKAAAGGLSKFDPNILKGQDPKALLAKMPAGMAAMLPKGVDLNSAQAKAMMANPAALASLKLPAGMNLAAMMG